MRHNTTIVRSSLVAFSVSILSAGIVAFYNSAQAQLPVGPALQAPVVVAPAPPSAAVETANKMLKWFKPDNGLGAPKPVSEAEQKAAEAKTTTIVPVEAAPPPPPERPTLLSQPALGVPQVDEAQVSTDNPPLSTTKLDDPNNAWGLLSARNQLDVTAKALKEHQLELAHQTIVPLRQWLVEATEGHITLYKALNTVSSARVQAELEKQVALDFAMLRDKAMYLRGLVFQAEGDGRGAIKEWVEVVKSQPRSDLGLRAYEQLQKMGFTEKLTLTP